MIKCRECGSRNIRVTPEVETCKNCGYKEATDYTDVANRPELMTEAQRAASLLFPGNRNKL